MMHRQGRPIARKARPEEWEDKGVVPRMSNVIWWPDGRLLEALAESFICSEDSLAQPFWDFEGTHNRALEDYLRNAIGKAARQWAENRAEPEREGASIDGDCGLTIEQQAEEARSQAEYTKRREGL